MFQGRNHEISASGDLNKMKETVSLNPKRTARKREWEIRKAKDNKCGWDINTDENVPNEVETCLNGAETDLNGAEENLNGVESDVASSESDGDAMPEEDDSEVDEELRSPRAEKRSEAGIDRCFEDIGRNKFARYVGRLGGDEDFIDSSDCDNDDSEYELDVDVVRGVDLPARKKSTKIKYDPDCVVAIF
ncbi:hypothetical protein K7X08_019500 [Anisodus acutangulus]|uniref:Uncharacterized protein n=1 Tax=Anisodus acutangulus TaxID=402998 RepID=A0A9Q1MRS0_9SOLA|nr:hypothetical protein K7X08_019500 [Anisodus acutangulus]